MLVTGFSRNEAIVAPWNWSLARKVGEIGRVGVSGGVGGRRSFAASQSSSMNYLMVIDAFKEANP
jgi:hypothetical protein